MDSSPIIRYPPGALFFAAPEGVLQPETPRDVFQGDLWSAGAMIYFLFCGASPYSRSCSNSLFKADREKLRQALRSRTLPFPPDIPEEVKSIILLLMNFDVDSRKPLEEVLQRLKDLQGGRINL